MAKKKTAKKRPAPSRACEKCSERYHPMKKECPHCGAANPVASGVKKKSSKKKPVKKKPAASKAVAAPTGLEAAIAFVQQSGGLDQAKKSLETIERIKNL